MELLPIRKRVRGPMHPGTLKTMNLLANTLLDQGHPEEARRHFERFLEMAPDHAEAANARDFLEYLPAP